MDNNTDIRYYQNCGELPMFNFDKVRREQDFKWLVYGYDGWRKVELPKKVDKIWGKIINEYSELTANNSTIQYFELVVDKSDLELRYKTVKTLIHQLDTRLGMDEGIKKNYIEELKGWRFYINESKPFEGEIKKMISQLRAVKSKINLFDKEVTAFENKTGETDLTKIKVTIQNIIKRDLDLKKMSVKEWVFTLETLPKQSNGK